MNNKTKPDIGVITVHFGENHGSVLQAYALTKYLSNCDSNVEVIDYIPPRYSTWNDLIKRKKGQYPLVVIVAYYMIAGPKRYFSKKRFSDFLKKHVPLTRRYRTKEELRKNPPDKDIYIAGSDQIWNDDYNGIDEFSYYLDFVPKGKKRIAYAASFGKEPPLPEEMVKLISPKLQQMDAISVRESNAIDILAQCGTTGVHVVDPTMLLTTDEWSHFAGKRRTDDEYILVYVMDGLYKGLLDYAERIKALTGWKIHVVCFSPIKDARITKCHFRCRPDDFVALIRDAEFVVTNSFHGTAFSVIFGNKLLAVGKNNYNSRIISLLNKLGLSGRFTADGAELNEERIVDLLNTSDNCAFRSTLGDWIKESMEFLNRELTEMNRLRTGL